MIPKLRLVSTVFAENLDGGRHLFVDEIEAFIEMYRVELVDLWRRFRTRESAELANRITEAQRAMHAWRRSIGARGRCPCAVCNDPQTLAMERRGDET